MTNTTDSVKGDALQGLHPESLRARPDLRDEAFRLDELSFPRFLVNNRTAEAFVYVADNFPELVILLCRDDEVLATCFVAPIALLPGVLPERGWEGALGTVLAGGQTTALFAFSIAVAASARGLGLGGRIIEELKSKAIELGFVQIITPVRPTGASKYPDLTIDQYAHLVDNRNGYSVDNWVRTLQRHGGVLAGVGVDSHIVKTEDGEWPSVSQWEEWTSMKFSHDGEYDIPGGCAKLKIYNGRGEYSEDCIWVVFDLTT